MSTYAKVKQEYESKAGVSLEDGRMPCRWCSTPTELKWLSLHGARCAACFDAHSRSLPAAPEWMADKRTDGPKAWAHVLKAREARGERLSSAQRIMWRQAIAQRVTSDEGLA